MLAISQRILSASVIADGEPSSQCGRGFLILLGVSREDTEEDARLLAEKIAKLRVFQDAAGKMNCSIGEVDGAVMVVPNFTLYASYKKGNRPDFFASAPPERAEGLFTYFCEYIAPLVPAVCRGKFRSDMQVSLVNDGPVTIPMDSRVLRGERSI